MKKIYSPKQIFASTLLGTPIAAHWMISSNKKAMDLKQTYSMLAGFSITIVMIIIYNLITKGKDIDQFTLIDLAANFAFVFLPSIIYGNYAARKLLCKTEVKESTEYNFRSNWKVLLITSLCFSCMIILNSLTIITLDALGIIQINWEEL